MGPKAAPGVPPTAPWPEVVNAARPRGPCCWALMRYVAKESGRLPVGDAGWARGVWSIAAVERVRSCIMMVIAVMTYEEHRACLGSGSRGCGRRFGGLELDALYIVGWQVLVVVAEVE